MNRESSLPALRCVLWFVIVFIPLQGVTGQIEMKSFYRGGYYPVIGIWGDIYYVDYEGKKREGDPMKIRFEKTEAYGEGYVEVAFGEPSYEEANTKKERATKKQFVMEAELSADRRLKNCYAVLLFSSNGSMSTFYKGLGTLGGGGSKKIKIRMPAHVSQLGSLHVFSDGLEIRTNQSQPGLDLEEEFAALTDGFRGVPLAVIYNNRRDYAHRLSPGGKRLATYRDQGTHYDLVIIETGELKIYDRVQVGKHDEWIQDPVWVDDENLLFIHDEKLKAYNLAKKGEIETVRSNMTQIVKAVGDDEHIIVWSKYSERYLNYNYKTRKDDSYYQWATGTSGVWFDGNGDARVRRWYKNGRMSFDFREDGRSAWKSIDSVNKERGLSFDFGYRQMLDQDLFIASFAKDPNTLYLFSTHESDTQGLYTYDLKSGKLLDRVYHDADYDLGGPSLGGTWLLHNRDRDLLGISYWRDRLVTKWFEPSFAEVQQMVDAALPQFMNRPIDWTDDGKTLIFYSFNEQDPGSYFLLQLETGQMRKIMDVQPKLKDYELARTQAIKWRARDGAVIEGYLTMPPQAKSAAPLLVRPHGGPHVRDTMEFDTINQFWATRGFAVLEINYRGSAGYGVEHRNSALIGNLATTPLDDIADGVRFLIDQGAALEGKVAIFGASWGGYSVYMSLIRYPELYQCGVAFAAPTDMGLMLLSDAYVGNTGGRAFWERILEGSDLPEGYKALISPINLVDRIQDPVMIVHGEYDYRITLDQAKFMAKELERQGKEFEFVILPDTGHGYSQSALNHYLNKADAFVRRHLDLSRREPSEALVSQ